MCTRTPLSAAYLLRDHDDAIMKMIRNFDGEKSSLESARHLRCFAVCALEGGITRHYVGTCTLLKHQHQVGGSLPRAVVAQSDAKGLAHCLIERDFMEPLELRTFHRMMMSGVQQDDRRMVIHPVEVKALAS